MKRLQRITEADVIAEFLKNEFYQEEFHHDRGRFEGLVLDADLTNEAENALRRALLFRRRGHMWRELPPDTQWWQVQLEPQDLPLIRVFPRAQWRKLANGSFLLTDIVKRIRSQRFTGKTAAFISRIQLLSYSLRVTGDNSSVMLIGLDEEHPVTIIEGNHRLTAAMLASPAMLETRFRVLCGFSPHMMESCWYETNIPNLWRYGKNRLKHLLSDSETDINHILREYRLPQEGMKAALSEAVSAPNAMPESKGSA
jgi:hypothetical protein